MNQLTPRHLMLVFVGGALGVLAREVLLWLAQQLPDTNWLTPPVVVLGVNVMGSLLLGLVFAASEPSSNAQMRAARVRLFLATGVLGGFTTYSAVSAVVVEHAVGAHLLVAVAYGLGTLGLSAGAAALGLLMGARLARTLPGGRRGGRINA